MVIGVPIDAEAHEYACFLDRVECQCSHFVNEHIFIQFQVVLHVDLYVMYRVLLLQVVLIDELHSLPVLLG